MASLNKLYILTIAGSPAHLFFGDAIFVCVDFEGWQGEYANNPSKTRITVLDTRRLYGPSIQEWRTSELHTFHFRVKDNMSKNPDSDYACSKMHPRDFQYGTSQILPAANRSYLLGTFFRIQADADSLEYRLWPEIHRQSDFKRAHFTRSYDTCSVWLGNNSYDNVLDRRRKCAPAYHSLYCGGDGELTPRLDSCTEDHWMAIPCLLRSLPTRRRGYPFPPLTMGACK